MLITKFIVKLEDRGSGPVPGTTNWAACKTQGFLLYAGGHMSICYNCALCVYYVCVIKLNYSDTKIKKKVEPFLHAIPWAYAIIFSSCALATKSINPGISMCMVAEYRPQDCESDDCVRGLDYYLKFRLADVSIMIIVFIAIILMMTVVYLKVWRQERRMRNAGYRSTNSVRNSGLEVSMIAGRQNQQAQANNSFNLSLRLSLRKNVTNSRKVLNQAMAYAGAYLATWIFYICSVLIILFGGDSVTIALIATFVGPLQGKSQMR